MRANDHPATYPFGTTCNRNVFDAAMIFARADFVNMYNGDVGFIDWLDVSASKR